MYSFSILIIGLEIKVEVPLVFFPIFSFHYFKFLFQTLVDQIVSIKNVEFRSANQGALILKWVITQPTLWHSRFSQDALVKLLSELEYRQKN